MKYLIKLLDRESGREGLIECPSHMPLEELSAKIKVELQLPLCDHARHCFLMNGKVYVPDDWAVGAIWEREEYFQTRGEEVQYYRNLPDDRAIRYSDRYRLSQVFTVLGSTITYIQNSVYTWPNVRCTLVARYR